MMATRKLALTLVTLYLAFYLCRYSILPGSPYLIGIYGTATYGTALSALFLGYALALLPAGLIVERLGAKKTILAGFVGTSVANLALFLMPQGQLLVYALFLNGVSQGLIWPSIMQIVAENFDQDRVNWVIGALLTAAILGPSTTYLVGGLLGIAGYWRAIFLAFPMILTASTAFFYIQEINDRTPRPDGFKLSRIDARVASLALMYFCFYALMRGFLGWIPKLFITVMNVGEAEASLYSSLFSLFEAIGAFLGGLLASRLEKPEILFKTSFLTAAILLIAAATTRLMLYLAITAFFLISMPEWLFFSRLPAILEKKHVAFASGLIDSMGYIGSSTSNMLITLTIEAQGDLNTVFLLLSIFSATGFLASNILLAKRNSLAPADTSQL